GITRAEKELYITHASMRTLYGRTSYNPMSRFITEIPDNLIERLDDGRDSMFGGFQSTPSKPKINLRAATAPKRKARKVETTTGAENQEWQVGDKAAHKVWGIGTVVRVQGEGDGL